MNFGLMLSNKVEDMLDQVHRDENWSQQDEAREYERCLNDVLEEDGRAWADGNVRIGDYILLSTCFTGSHHHLLIYIQSTPILVFRLIVY